MVPADAGHKFWTGIHLILVSLASAQGKEMLPKAAEPSFWATTCSSVLYLCSGLAQNVQTFSVVDLLLLFVQGKAMPCHVSLILNP